MAFKKSKQKSQPDLFATASFSLPERERRYMEDELSWHNEFYRNVLLNIDEEILRPLFVDGNMGAPTKQLRILIAMRMLKEGRGCSDEQLYENVRFNLVWRQAVGLFNINDECPSIDSYYMLFRRIAEYEQNNPEHVNLYKKIYQDLTAKQIKKYKIAGRTIRMDSKLIGSNIAWFSRYEIIHETFRKQVSEQSAMCISDQLYRQKALDFLAEGNHIGLHLFIGGVVFSGDHAVFTAMAVQEGLGLVPQVSALFTQSKNLIHSDFLHFFISKATAVSSGLPLSLGCQG